MESRQKIEPMRFYFEWQSNIILMWWLPTIPIMCLNKKQMDMIYNEISVMKSMNHPYIVKLYDAFQTDQHFFLFS